MHPDRQTKGQNIYRIGLNKSVESSQKKIRPLLMILPRKSCFLYSVPNDGHFELVSFLPKQGPQGPQKLSFLKSLKIPTTTKNTNIRLFHSCNHRKWLSYQERPNRLKNYGDMVEKAKRDVVIK